MEPKIPEMGSKSPQEMSKARLLEIAARLTQLANTERGETHASDEELALMEEQARIEKELGIHTE